MASTLTVDNIVGATTAANVKLPADYILQVKHGILTAASFTTQSASFTNITGLSVNITPKFATSKILITLNLMVSINAATMYVRMTGGNSAGIIGDDTSSSRVSAFMGLGRQTGAFDISESALCLSGQMLDSPATTSVITYQPQVRASDSSSRTIHVNKAPDDSDQVYRGRYVSTITAMEIAQ
jgi:hypothetical protein